MKSPWMIGNHEQPDIMITRQGISSAPVFGLMPRLLMGGGRGSWHQNIMFYCDKQAIRGLLHQLVAQPYHSVTQTNMSLLGKVWRTSATIKPWFLSGLEWFEGTECEPVQHIKSWLRFITLWCKPSNGMALLGLFGLEVWKCNIAE